jgi:hypothetical protein
MTRTRHLLGAVRLDLSFKINYLGAQQDFLSLSLRKMGCVIFQEGGVERKKRHEVERVPLCLVSSSKLFELHKQC